MEQSHPPEELLRCACLNNFSPNTELSVSFLLVTESYCSFFSNVFSPIEFFKNEMSVLTKGVKPVEVVVKVELSA